ncbi:hypothetical protein F3Y22_tig00004046pilonHSYRG00079 [Hibiscus syriacus]|uniref:Uncharacterized protein n=1 Tax=Hibiscus syriacus TaxID=106335 RepID=A0A6A3CNF9_HIBSY|nr:hypothetical protein F3Y22_tig00004046pilonHSYRG00079 [Hibiscus syriacus]
MRVDRLSQRPRPWKIQEETLCEDFLRIDTNRNDLASFVPKRLNNLAGENELLTSLNLNTPTTTLLFLLLLPLLPSFRQIVGLSSVSELQST